MPIPLRNKSCVGCAILIVYINWFRPNKVFIKLLRRFEWQYNVMSNISNHLRQASMVRWFVCKRRSLTSEILLTTHSRCKWMRRQVYKFRNVCDFEMKKKISLFNFDVYSMKSNLICYSFDVWECFAEPDWRKGIATELGKFNYQ